MKRPNSALYLKDDPAVLHGIDNLIDQAFRELYCFLPI